MTPFDSNTLVPEKKKASEKAGKYAAQAANKVSEITHRVQSSARDISRRVRNGDVDETTVPDAFRRVPKYVSPRTHRWLDFAVTTYFLGLGVCFAMRDRGRAATAAFINGGMIAGISMLTDYAGDGRKPISFKMHGTLDAVQATTAALGPVLHGFAGEPEAKYFWTQAAKEIGVIATTDWDAGMPESQRSNAA